MGHLFEAAGLTVPNSALMGANGQPTFVGSPQQVLNRANAALPSSSQILGSDVLNPENNAPQNLPKIGTPTPQQAAQAGATPGGANAMSPALTKGGKLATLLMSGLQGALAGRAASEQAVIQSGGRRSGGVGTGFQAGFTLPWQRSMLPLEYQQKQAETQLAQAGLQPVHTRYGDMPLALAKNLFPQEIRYQTAMDVQQQKGQTAENVQQMKGQSAQNVAQINKRFIPVQGVGLFDTQSRQVVPGTAQSITVTPEIAQDYQLPQEFIGKPMTLSNLAAVERAQSQQETTVQGEGGPALVNKRSKQVTPLGLGNPGMGRPLQVGDVNNPGETTYMTGGQAIRSGAPGAQSASVQVPKAAAKAEVPTKIGDKTVAFNTMLQHAQLLRQAAKALQNGNVRLVNSLSNRAMSEFGDPALTDFHAIANAYNHEVTDVISKGHMTDTEVAKGGATMPDSANYATIDKVLSSYEALARSKMTQLNNQKQAAIQQAQPRGGKNAQGQGNGTRRTIVF